MERIAQALGLRSQITAGHRPWLAARSPDLAAGIYRELWQSPCSWSAPRWETARHRWDSPPTARWASVARPPAPPTPRARCCLGHVQHLRDHQHHVGGEAQGQHPPPAESIRQPTPERHHQRSAQADAGHDPVHLRLGIAKVSGQVEVHKNQADPVAGVLPQG